MLSAASWRAAACCRRVTSLAALAVLVQLSDLDDPYLARQIRPVTDPLDSGDYSTALATGEAAKGDSRSNAQRGFAIAGQRLI